MKSNSILIPLTVAALCAAESFAAPMGTAFTYQGRLNDGGQPANNLYDLTFTLHDDPLNPATVGTYIILTAVPVTNGLFTVELNSGSEFGPNAFNGAARWLQIGVRTNSSNNAFNNFTFLSPRQPLTAAPYALFASNSLSSLSASMASNVIDGAITGSKLAPGAVTWSGISGIPAGFADGVDNDTTYSAGAGLNLSGANQFSVNFAGSGSANTAARTDHGHFGAVWGGSASLGLGLSVTNGAGNSVGLYGQQGTGSGFPYIFGNTAGVWGESSSGNGVWGGSGWSSGSGVRGISLGTNGYGVHGMALATNGTTYGVYGESKAPAGSGVYGLASGAAGTNTHGVFGKCNSTNGGSGVFGLLQSPVTNPQRNPWTRAGVMGESSQLIGVAGYSDDYYGVFGSSVDGNGVAGYGDSGSGVVASSRAGVALRAYCSSNSVIEGYGVGSPTPFWVRVFRVSNVGDVYAKGTFHPGGADFAEMLPAQNTVEAGDVLVIGEDGKLARSTHPYQENVAGVHATKPGLLGGAHDGADLTGKSPLAIVGVVPVKVTNENGSIKPGDKLTTSSTAGHAMKADKHAEIGTVIGKSLSALKGDRGVIDMLVILQ